MPDSATKRDPRIDPRAGDVLKRGDSTVTIDRISSTGVSYTFDGLPSAMPPLVSWNIPWLPYWRKWAATAEVIAEAASAR